MEPMQVLDGPILDTRWNYYALTLEEKEDAIRLNKERGTLHLVEYRNSKQGRSDEIAYKIELGKLYGRIVMNRCSLK